MGVEPALSQDFGLIAVTIPSLSVHGSELRWHVTSLSGADVEERLTFLLPQVSPLKDLMVCIESVVEAVGHETRPLRIS